VSNIRVTKTRNTLTLEVHFPAAVKSGRVSCAAFLHNTLVSKSDTIVTSGYTVAYAAGASAVNVTITGLKSVVDYDAYCSLTTVDGVANTDSQAVATKRTVQTACCKLLTFTNAPSFVYGSLSKYTSSTPTAQYVYSFTLSSAPADSVVVTPTLFDSDGNAVSAGVLKSVPTSLTYSSTATNLAGTFVLSASSAGLSGAYTVKLVPSGNSAAAYGGSVTATSIQVLSTASAAPKPVLSSAKFADSGSSIDVSFDSVTNKGGITANSWACSTVLTFVASGYTTCSWVSASTVRITFTSVAEGTTLLAVGGTITNVPALVAAQCPADTDCSLYGKADAVSVTVSAPDSPVVPTVVLQVPAVVSNCDDVKVNPTLTSGNGGRAWTTVLWTVSAASGASTTAIQALLTGTTSVITIPKASVPSDRYTLSLTVTNFLGQSSTTSATFSVDGNPNLPIISILGPTTVSTVPGDALTLYTSTARTSCYLSASTISYAWTVRKGGSDGEVQTAIRSTSTSPTKFSLGGYALETATIYTVEFTATASAAGDMAAISAVSRVTVNVGKGNIVAQVAGGNFRAIASSSGSFALDASGSYDQSYPKGSVASPLSYLWSCKVVGSDNGNYGNACPEQLPTDVVSSTLAVPTAGLVFGELYQFTVTVSATDGRTGAYAVTLQNSEGSTATSITNTVLTKVNPSKKFVLTGYVQGGYSLDARWSALIDGAVQTFTPGSPATGTFAAAQVASALAFPLSVPANTFSAGTTVVFRLAANFAGDSTKFPSYSDVSITMNAPPSGGTLVSDRTSGFALDDTFTLIASSWSDEASDFPLSYEFIYVLVKGQPSLTIQSRTSTNQVSTKLPGGMQSESYAVYVSVNVYDTYLSFGTSTISVEVTTPVNVDVSAYISDAITAATAAGNTDQITSAISNAASSVNNVDCSLASPSYCADLNRQNCLNTPQTCSACLDGYTGLSGDRNTLCRDASDTTVLGAEGDACDVDSDCELSSCSSNVCVAPVKACSSVNAEECSGHGTCSYSQPNGAAYGRTCTIKDTDCTARCICDDEYGGSACSLSEEELVSRDATRAQLCDAVITVSAGDDPSTQLLDSLINALYTSFDPNEVVSAAAEQTCYDAMSTLSSLAAKGYLSDESVSQMMSLTAKFAKHSSDTTAESGLRRRRRRLADSSDDTTALDHSEIVNAAVTSIVEGVLGNMASGEDPVNIATDEMQIVIQSTLASSLTSLSPPQTADAASYGSGVTSMVEMSEESLSLFATSDGYVQASVMAWGVNPFPNSSNVESSLLRLQVNANFSDDSGDSEVRRRTQEALRNGSLPGFYVTLQYTNVQDFDFSMTLDEVFANPPANFTYPGCNYFSAGEYKPCTGCWVTAYTNYNVTYGCPLSFLKDLSGTRRRLQEATDDASAMDPDVNFGVVFKSIGRSFTHTLSRNPFNVDWATAKPVVVYLSILSFFILLGFWYFRRWDMVDKGYLVYAKPEAERQQFYEKHRQLLERYHLDRNFNLWEQTKRASNRSSLASSVMAVLLPGGGLVVPASPHTARTPRTPHSPHTPPRTPHSPYSFVSNPATPVSNKNGVARGLVRATSTKQASHAQYEALFDTTLDQENGEHALYVSNVVANFLDSVMPEHSLQKNSETTWSMFVYTVLRYHSYTAMFFGASIKFNRVMRWTTIVLGFLLNMFFKTLFYGIFYPDEGTCEVYTTEDSCLTEQSKISTDTLCQWTADPTLEGGGSCALTPPPGTFVFMIIVVLCTTVITVPVAFVFDYILYNICVKRPRFEDWGMISEYWVGRSTRTLSAKKENQEAPIHALYYQVDYERKRRPQSLTEEQSHAVREKHAADAETFQARKAYDSYMSADYEANELLQEIRDFLDVHVNAPKVPWQNSKYTVMTQAKAVAIQKFVGVYPDGRPVPMTVYDWLCYGSPKKKLNALIDVARKKSAHIQSQMREFGDGELQNRDMMLIQYFILEQFGTFKQFVLKRHMFDFNVSTPKSVGALTWLSGWLFLFLSIAFLLYWAFVWGVSQAGNTVVNWGANTGQSLAQDIFVIQVFKVYVIYSLSMISIKPQLQYIYRVLSRVAISYAQDEFVDDYLDIRVCQHLSPACRAAHSHVAANLATASILRHVDDADVEVCRLKYEINFAAIAMVIFTVPVLVSLISEAAGEGILEALLPAAFDGMLIVNYFFYTGAGLFILMPYLLAIGFYLWKHRVDKPSRKMLLSRRNGETSAEFTRRWNAAKRQQQGKTLSMVLNEQFAGFGYYATRPLLLFSSARDFLFGFRDPASDRIWCDMNRAAGLHGRVLDQPLPTPDYSYAARVTEMRADEALKEVIKQRVPAEVHAVLCAARQNWVQAWSRETANVQTHAQIGVQTRNSRYLSARLMYDLTHVHVSEPSSPRSPDAPPSPTTPVPGDIAAPFGLDHRHSHRVSEYHDRHRPIHTADEAAEYVLRIFKKHVASGRMSLVDPEEGTALQTATFADCNVLVEFYNLRVLLDEVLNVYRPQNQAFSKEERDEIVDSCYGWLNKQGDNLLTEHYGNNEQKVKAAVLSRQASSMLMVGAKSDPQTHDTNFSVPFQKFRRWFETTAAAVQRYREMEALKEAAVRSARGTASVEALLNDREDDGAGKYYSSVFSLLCECHTSHTVLCHTFLQTLRCCPSKSKM
jgi:hypothetical protein